MKIKNLFQYLIPLFCLFISCKSNIGQSSYSIIQINNGWTFKQVSDTSKWRTAKVPGTVHTDLMFHHVIPNPYYRTNENLVQWIENQDWEYKTTFSIDDNTLNKENIELLCKGLDTYADVYVNNKLIITADNMFIAWNANVKKLLVKGNNELRIVFKSAVRLGMEKLKKLPYLLKVSNEQAPFGEQSNIFTRKAPYHYGWDWGPRLVTCGIWLPIEIHAWDKARIENFHIIPVKISKEIATYTIETEIFANEDMQIELQANVEIEKPIIERLNLKKGLGKYNVKVSIDKPEFWWTNGLGKQKLYPITLRLSDSGKAIDQKQTRIGVRTLELVQEPDSIGASFYFKLNGVPVFAKGANYIPSDMFIPSVTDNIYKRVINDAISANMNMLRVWGGAIYEKDIFYDLCDEKGILVWQDFMFACGLQPGDSAHLQNIKNEAEYNVKRLRNHPSLAIWCGDNENWIAWYKWRWDKHYSKTDSATIWSDYKKINLEILPNAVKEFDGQLTYWSSSPSDGFGLLPTRKRGDEHDWTVWFAQKPFSNFYNNLPRFVSEYGMQSYSSRKTMETFSIAEDWGMDTKIMRHRQRCNLNWIKAGMDGNDMIYKYMTMYFPEAKGMDTLIYLSQSMQALGMKTATEAHRSNRYRCMGSMYWQINDCWPTTSWASVDYYGRWKPSHYAIRKAYQTYLAVAHTGKDSMFTVSVVSDTIADINALVTVELLDFAGKRLKTITQNTMVKANSATEVLKNDAKLWLKNIDKNKSFVNISVVAQNRLLCDQTYYWGDPKDLKLPEPNIKYSVKTKDQAIEITLTSDKLAKGVWLEINDKEGFFSDNFFDLMPGFPKKIIFTTNETLTNVEKSLKIVSLYNFMK